MGYNTDFISVLDKLRGHYQVKGKFMKSRAYEKARDSLILYNKEITNLNQLKDIPNVGKSTIGKLTEWIETGKIDVLENSKNDPEIMFSNVYGIGPKKAKELVKTHGITTIQDLRKNQNSLLNDVQKKGLKYYEDILKRIPRNEIKVYESKMLELFNKVKNEKSTLNIVGSYRRGKLDSGDIDVIICDEKDDNKVFNDFLDLMIKENILIEVLSRGNIKSLGVSKLGDRPARRIDFMFTPRRENAFAILYFTGSKEFNTAMRSQALKMGYSLNEHGLYKMNNKKKGEKLTKLFSSEKDVFDFLNIEYTEPENRKGANSMIVKSVKKSISKPKTLKKGKIKTPGQKTLKKKKSVKNENKKIKKKKSVKIKENDVLELVNNFKQKGGDFLKSLTEQQLSEMIILANKKYYCNDASIMTDGQYDLLKEYVEEIYPDNDVVKEGHTSCDVAVDKKKVTLPYEMWSMDKLKDEKAIQNKLNKYKGPYVLSTKMDGISVLYYAEGKYKSNPQLYTRGNGKKGQDITHLIPYLNLPKLGDVTIRGELIIKKKLFQTKYSSKFSNARNFVSGIANSKKITNMLRNMVSDLDFIAYEVIHPQMSPAKQMEYLSINWGKEKTVLFQVEKKVDKELLSNYLMKWRDNYEYEIDGIIVTHDEIFPRQSKNPEHAFAFKMVLSDQIVEAIVIDVLWSPSKDGYLKPRVKLQPVNIGGATIEYATAHNAAFVRDNGLGVGSVVQLIRSGDVIPKVHKMIHKTDPKMPSEYSYIWTKGNVDIKLSDEDLKENKVVKTKIIEEFFKKIEVVGLGYKNVLKLYDAGYNDIEKIVKMKIEDIAEIPGLGKKSGEKIVESIQERLKLVDLHTLMAASHCFGRGIGERKIKELLSNYPFIITSKENKELKIQKVSKLKGFNIKTANQIVPYINRFKNFANSLGILYKVYDLRLFQNVKTKNPLMSKKLVVTGKRDKELMKKLKDMGITTSSSVSKNTDYVIVSSLSEETSKVSTAKKLGVTIITSVDFIKKYL
jgi:DNA ligase (NAD+)